MIVYTEERIQYMREIIPGRSFKESREMFNAKFGLNITEDGFHNAAKRFGIHNGFTGRFEKGQQSHNKGHKMSPEQYEKCKATMFKPGMRTHNHRPVGSERINSEGFVQIKVAEPNVWKHKHVLEWEKHNGPVPKNHALIFRDSNRQNCSIDNLCLVKRSELLQINRNRLKSDDPKLTDAGVLLAKLMIKTNQRKKEK